MTINLGFKVKKDDAEKPDVQYRSPQGGVMGTTHNGTIKNGVRARLFALSIELHRKDKDTYPTMAAAEAQVFAQFWREWKALS